MTDIVDRLNYPSEYYYSFYATNNLAALLRILCQEAADEIERLRAELAMQK